MTTPWLPGALRAGQRACAGTPGAPAPGALVLGLVVSLGVTERAGSWVYLGPGSAPSYEPVRPE